jgi:hypothetical protein
MNNIQIEIACDGTKFTFAQTGKPTELINSIDFIDETNEIVSFNNSIVWAFNNDILVAPVVADWDAFIVWIKGQACYVATL